MTRTIAVANHAESGESLKSSLSAKRLEKVLSTLRAGDYLFIQFGHNDMKAVDAAAGRRRMSASASRTLSVSRPCMAVGPRGLGKVREMVIKTHGVSCDALWQFGGCSLDSRRHAAANPDAGARI
jgi:hypothetical protein